MTAEHSVTLILMSGPDPECQYICATPREQITREVEAVLRRQRGINGLSSFKEDRGVMGFLYEAYFALKHDDEASENDRQRLWNRKPLNVSRNSFTGRAVNIFYYNRRQFLLAGAPASSFFFFSIGDDAEAKEEEEEEEEGDDYTGKGIGSEEEGAH